MTQFDEESLKIESDGCVCEFEGCGRVFQGSSQLHMHQVKHHQGKKLSVRSGNSQFYCPVDNCERSRDNAKPFPRLGQLKQVTKVS